MMPDPDNTGAAEADLVIEAGPEDPEIKGKIYADLEPRMKSTATLATNTSSLSLDKLAEGLRRPKRFAGLHFFNPVPKMPLVEVVRHAETYGTVSDQLARFCGAIGKLPARVANYPGFLVNRALTPYLLEALVLVDEGVPKETIDRAAEDFGMPTGPVELADYVGLDICLHVADSLKADLDRPLADVPGWFRDKVEDEGELGKKSGKGLYIWEDGEAQKNGEAAEPEAELTDRLILPMLDACVECLRREVVQDADHADAAMIFGAGFAPFRGGPMRHARARGIETVTKRLSELEDKHGARFAPDAGWTDLGPHAE
jgi:3-hydroxyacyl-CoA dehydrogenase/enoyl-CoA hydratase/3-hydroxybutyryl-CoA epimerase